MLSRAAGKNGQDPSIRLRKSKYSGPKRIVLSNSPEKGELTSGILEIGQPVEPVLREPKMLIRRMQA
jgi:hypothetical protein